MNMYSFKGAVLGLGLAVFAAGSAAADMLADIKASGEMTFGTEMHYAPFDLLVNGQYEGLCKDLMDEVTKDLGVTPSPPSAWNATPLRCRLPTRRWA